MAAIVETAEPRTLRLHAEDNIAVAIDPLAAGLKVAGVTTRGPIPRGHKVATREIAEGAAIRKFGQIIGFATRAIAPGEHVHEHNCAMKDFARDYRFAEAAQSEELLPEAERASFQGYRRDSGRVGTRNYIGILTSVNCSASVARFIAQAAEREGLLADYPNVDGVVALVHGTGCGMAMSGEGYDALQAGPVGLRRAPQPGRRASGRPGLRGLPDPALHGGLRPGPRARASGP